MKAEIVILLVLMCEILYLAPVNVGDQKNCGSVLLIVFPGPAMLAELQAKYPQTWPKIETNQHFDPITHLKPKYLKFKKLETPPAGFGDKPRRGWVCYGVITGKIYSNQLHFDAREASWASHPEIWVKKEIEAEIEKEKGEK